MSLTTQAFSALGWFVIALTTGMVGKTTICEGLLCAELH